MVVVRVVETVVNIIVVWTEDVSNRILRRKCLRLLGLDAVQSFEAHHDTDVQHALRSGRFVSPEHLKHFRHLLKTGEVGDTDVWVHVHVQVLSVWFVLV